MRIVNVCGARPNFMKIAPLMREYARHPDIEPLLVHTGQHYDEKMSDLIFRELEIPEPLLTETQALAVALPSVPVQVRE